MHCILSHRLSEFQKLFHANGEKPHYQAFKEERLSFRTSKVERGLLLA